MLDPQIPPLSNTCESIRVMFVFLQKDRTQIVQFETSYISFGGYGRLNTDRGLMGLPLSPKMIFVGPGSAGRKESEVELRDAHKIVSSLSRTGLIDESLDTCRAGAAPFNGEKSTDPRLSNHCCSAEDDELCTTDKVGRRRGA